MKKKLLALLLIATTAICGAFALAGCSEKDGETGSSSNDNQDIEQELTHTHSFTEKVTESKFLKTGANCTNKAVYYYSCTCGETGTETFEYGQPKGHKFDKEVSADKYLKTAATYDDVAIYYYSCECGEIGTETFNGDVLHPTESIIYTLNSDKTEYTVTGVEGSYDGQLVIAPEIDGIPVTSIEHNALFGSIKSIAIPDSVKDIDMVAFKDCQISSIMVSDRNQYFNSQDNCLLTKDGKKLLLSCNNGIIPDGVTSIGNYAFNSSRDLTSITIPDSVTNIVGNAFCKCEKLIQTESGVQYVDRWAIGCESQLTQISFRTDTRGIAVSAFITCNELTSITIPDSVKTICNRAFKGYALESITVSAGNANYKSENNCLLTKDGKTLVLGYKNSVIAEGVTNIRAYAFYGCKGLTNITIPDGVTSIGNCAFDDCRYLTNITIPGSVTSIGIQTFMFCSDLRSITLKGTKEQWLTIEKGRDWNKNTHEYTVHCSNGDLDKNGNEIPASNA